METDDNHIGNSIRPGDTNGCPQGIRAELESLTDKLEEERCKETIHKPRHRVAKSVALYMSFVAMGMTIGSWGPSLISLGQMLSVDIRTLGLCTAAISLGNSVRCVVAGWATEHLNIELMYGTDLLLCGVCFIVTPWATTLSLFVTLLAVRGVTTGVVDAGGQVYILNQWHGTKYQKPMYYTLHTLYYLGSTMAAFLVRPFLVSLSHVSCGTATTDINSTVTGLPLMSRNHTVGEVIVPMNLSMDTCNGTEAPTEGAEMLRYSFIIIGLACFIPAAMFYVLVSVQHPCLCLQIKTSVESTQSGHEQRNPLYRILLLVLFFLFHVTHLWAQITVASFLPAFVVKHLHWKLTSGSTVATASWGSILQGKMASIFLSMKISVRKLLVVSMLGHTVPWMFMIWLVEAHVSLIWISIFISGVADGPIFGASVMWLSKYIKVTGRVTTVMLLGVSVGSITVAPVTGYLIQTYSYMWVIYLAVISGVVRIAVWILAQIFATAYPKYMGTFVTDDKDENSAVKG